ncbi:MAG: TlpA family protein disulfide reductase [Thermoanaerobaculaceae bacterium]|nr:TlpA family protein disulfide reductase [Thermoanaerobaculaceae bacterium]
MKTHTVACLLGALLVGMVVTAADDRPVFPQVSLTDLDGRVVQVKDFQGAVVLLNVWATWCGPCRVELPELQKLYGELGGKGLVILAVAVDTPREKVRPFLERLGITIPAFLMDARTQQMLGIDRVPFSILLDREGKVVQIYAGYSPGVIEDIRRRTEAMVATPAGKQGGK